MIILSAKEIKEFFYKLKKDKVSEYTAQCAYFTVLSFVPFIIFFITLIQYINIDREFLSFVISKLVPINMNIFIENIIQEVYTKSIGTISVSVIFALWSAGKGVSALCKGFHSIYETSKEINFIYFRIKGVVCTLIFVIFLIIMLILAVFGRSINSAFKQAIPDFSKIISVIIKFSDIWIYVILFVVFLFMYKFVPNHKVKVKSQIIGAIFASVGWVTISNIFSLYLNVFRGFSIIYGSLTTIIITMMWIYVCMYIILIGAEINANIIKLKQIKK